MKSKISIAFFFVFAFVGFANKAQSQLKIGYTNVEYILSQLPEAKQIQQELEDYQKQLTTQIQSKVQEFQQRAGNYQQNAASMTEVARNAEERELQSMQTNLQQFQQDAEASMQKKQLDLLQPAYDKIQKAIQDVRKENGFTHIFSSDVGGAAVLLDAREEDNISDLVLKKLGITPPPKTEGN
ncbi:OmpH family outer membrane protein [Fulvivirgaceae bacterium BMA10]|uniref:OmpH family outer membrane protein n=1 Tax=Splendidivirga corallicola TaxID=3051826 RepID=A0ABT8KMW5_9BACT|nr:OmpH family outer membrane protein [Fulvivirgaceae bacterium BMA10]